MQDQVMAMAMMKQTNARHGGGRTTHNTTQHTRHTRRTHTSATLFFLSFSLGGLQRGHLKSARLFRPRENTGAASSLRDRIKHYDVARPALSSISPSRFVADARCTAWLLLLLLLAIAVLSLSLFLLALA